MCSPSPPSANGHAARRLGEAFPVSRAVLFGSLARGTIHDRSDIDLFVEGLPDGSILDAYAVASEGCELDVNVVPAERAKPYIAEAVAREGVVLWPRDLRRFAAGRRKVAPAAARGHVLDIEGVRPPGSPNPRPGGAIGPPPNPCFTVWRRTGGFFGRR
jgi:predicted nucleotidyltransferase